MVGCRIDANWKQQLEDRASRDGTDTSELLRGLIANYLDQPYGVCQRHGEAKRLTQLERRIGVIEGKLKSLAG